jgi:two-component system phosphate regulon sensor histidine kinase PhoR
MSRRCRRSAGTTAGRPPGSALSKLERPDARDALDRVETPVRQILAAVTRQYEAAAAEKRITIETEAEPVLSMAVHGQMIEQAVGNLLSNAIAYSGAGTTVTMTGRSEGRSVVFEVRDEGPGIAAEHLDRLFERFYRVDKARSRELGGTGLGLAIVKHVAQLHGGRAEVESKVGVGSTFRLSLPRA